MKNLIAILLLLPFAALADTMTFVCDFKTFSDPEGGLQKVTDPFILTFVFDTENGNAYMVGNNGSEEVSITPNSEGLTFIGVTETGNVMTTTIVSAGAAVHSRNSVIFGDLVPSQFYGQCEFR